MVESILKDKKKFSLVLPTSKANMESRARSQGFLSKLGAKALKVYQLKLQPEEQAQLDKSAAVKELIDVIKQKVGG
jgi:malate/lactate dehydrogenase